jgi:flagellar protein FliS
MDTQSDMARQYKRRQIESASPGRLIVLLYDGALDNLNKAELFYQERGDGWIEGYNNNLISAQNIVTELLTALDTEKGGEIAENLLQLYEFVQTRLIESNVKKDLVALEEARKVLLILREGWVEVQDSVSSEEAKPLDRANINLQG